MKLKKFMEMYSNWNGIVVINDNDLNTIVKDKAFNIIEKHKELWKMKVVMFNFCGNELHVRLW